MKYIYISILGVVSNIIFAQVAIGKNSVSSSGVSLEFGSGNKGLILPWVTNEASVGGAVPGTMIYDLASHKVKLKVAGSAWLDLSVDTTGTTVDTVSGVDGVIIQNNAISERSTSKVAILSSPTTPTSTSGILVLENTDKAMILPQVTAPHLNIENPAPGMVVFDPTNNMLCVYNGSVWSFWK